jgi:hypothetical protein
MRIAIALLMLLCLLTAGLVAPRGAFAGDLDSPALLASGQAGADDDGPFTVPKWRLAVRTYGYDSYSNPAIGVFHRVGTRHELGLAIDADLDFRNTKRRYAHQDTTYHISNSDYDDDFFSVTLYGELRRWNRISDKLMWYVGPRLVLGYTYRDDENKYESDTESWYEDWSYTLGLTLSAGADLKLLKRLSVTAGFVPIGVEHVWSQHQEGYVDEGRRLRRYHYKTHELTLDLNPYATAYLCLTF